MSASWPAFVCATVASGGPEATLLPGLARRAATCDGQLWALPSGRGALVPELPGRVHGELVDAPDDRVLRLLDLVEGVAEGQVRRELVDVQVGLRRERAWAWVTSAARARSGTRLDGGVWRARRRWSDAG